jgi:hypothetical protein
MSRAGQTSRHWRIECNRIRGTPMQVDTILTPAATQMASIAMRPTSSASFSATLASSVSSGAPEDSRNQSAAADSNANSVSKIGANVDARIDATSGTTSGTSIGSKSSPDAAPDRSASSSPSLNANMNSKPVFERDATSDVKPVKNSATVPDTAPSMPTFSKSVSSLIIFSPVGAPLAAYLGKWGLSAPATKLADPSSNQQPLAQQLTANLASVNALQPATPPALPIPQPVTGAAQSVPPGRHILSGAASGPSPQDQPGPAAISISAATSAVPLTNSGAAPARANFPASIEAGAKSSELPSSELPSMTGEAASGVAYSFSNAPPQPPAGATQFSTPSTAVSPTPTVLASLTPGTPTLDLPTPAPADTSTPISVSPAATPADSRPDALTSADVTGFAFDEFLPDRSSSASVLTAPFNPAPPVTLLSKAALSQLPNISSNISSNQPAFSSADKPSPALPTNPASAILPLTFSAQPPIPALPASVGGNSSVSAIESPIDSRSADPKLGDAKVDNSVPGDPMPANSAAAEPAPTSATFTSATAQAAGSPDAGFSSTNNLADKPAPSLTSALTPNSNAPAPTSASIVAATNDAGGSSKPGISTQPVLAIAPQVTAADKKSSFAGQPNIVALHEVAAAPGSDPSATLTSPATPASAPPLEVSSDDAPALPQAHQMLDGAPAAPITPPPAPIVPGSASDLQMAAQTNAQMHVGVRTDAFGTVEIHTVVEQSQVGITVHSDRDISRWFSSEVPGLESGLNNNHLNLTGVNFDHGRSGVQTATSFQQGQPRQHFSQTPGSPSAALPGTALAEKDRAGESTTIDILPAGSSIGPAGTHVSIHV